MSNKLYEVLDQLLDIMEQNDAPGPCSASFTINGTKFCMAFAIGEEAAEELKSIVNDEDATRMVAKKEGPGEWSTRPAEDHETEDDDEETD